MGKLSYALKRARKMDYRAMFKTADMLHKKTGKSRVWLMADMAKCAAKYNAGYVDYKITEMYRLNDAQRATQDYARHLQQHRCADERQKVLAFL